MGLEIEREITVRPEVANGIRTRRPNGVLCMGLILRDSLSIAEELMVGVPAAVNVAAAV